MPRGLSIPYRPEVDSLRAIAVISVILFHFGVLPGGFVGVDVFFVISGYLVIGGIVAQKDAGAFGLWGFYARRAARIAPALFAMVALVGALSVLLPVNANVLLPQFMHSALASSLFCFNAYVYLRTGYFDPPAANQILLHTWALSVEAQFYAICPLIAATICRLRPEKRGRALMATVLACLSIAMAVAHFDKEAAFYFMPTRLWEFFLGGWLGISGFTFKRVGAKTTTATVGLALIAAPAALFDASVTATLPVVWALLPCLGAAAFISGTEGHKGRPKSLLTCKPIVSVGRMSYSLYLWHWPLFVVYRNVTLSQDLAFPALCGLYALTLAVSALFYRLVERPSRNGLAKLALWKQAAILICCLACFSAVTLCIEEPHFIVTKGYAQGIDDRNNMDWEIPMPIGVKKEKIDFALLGDSHAEMLYGVFNDAAKNLDKAGLFQCSHKCPFLLNGFNPKEKEGWKESEAALKEAIAKSRPKAVFLISRWSSQVKGPKDYDDRHMFIARTFAYDGGQKRLYGAEAMEASLRDTVAFLTDSGVERVWLIMPVPENLCEIPQKAEALALFGGLGDGAINAEVGISMDAYRKRNKEITGIMRTLERDIPGVGVLDPTTALCPDGKCMVVENSRSLYFDDDHLSKTGAAKLRPLIEDALAQE